MIFFVLLVHHVVCKEEQSKYSLASLAEVHTAEQQLQIELAAREANTYTHMGKDETPQFLLYSAKSSGIIQGRAVSQNLTVLATILLASRATSCNGSYKLHYEPGLERACLLS
eukprot:2496997-Amphidinium_carterae.1